MVVETRTGGYKGRGFHERGGWEFVVPQQDLWDKWDKLS